MPNNQTKWTLFNSNEEAWASMLSDCAKAEKSIVLEQFIFTTDDFGQKLLDICVERASKGVDVRFLWDAHGSFTFSGSSIVADLKAKGIELLFWGTFIPGYYNVPHYRSWFLRNHRRTFVIDDKIGYTGSMCVRDSMKNWRDTNLRIEGPVVTEMSLAFEGMWARAKERHNRRMFSRPNRTTPDTSAEFYYETNSPFPGKRRLYQTLVKAIKEAKEYIYITTPYFVPTHRLAHALKDASERGVDVRILIPKDSNYYTVDLAARSFFSSLLKSGVRIFLYADRMIHSKTIAIDGTWSAVGSLNMDSVSLLYNFEANIISTNTHFAHDVEKHFLADVELSQEVKIEEWESRFFVEKIPEILIKVVRKFL